MENIGLFQYNIEFLSLANTKKFKIDEKGTLKATEHNYDNVASSVWFSLFMGSNGNAYYCPA